RRERRDWAPEDFEAEETLLNPPADPPAHQLEQPPVAEPPIPLHVVCSPALREARAFDEIRSGEQRADEGGDLGGIGRSVGVEGYGDGGAGGGEGRPEGTGPGPGA